MATVPFDTLAELVLDSPGLFKLLGILKLVRVFRLSRIITYLRKSAEFKSFINLLKLIFYLVLYMHCFGCLWWFIAETDD